MRKLILLAVVALVAIIWTVSVQSSTTAQAENCICVPGDQCDKCPNPCATPGQCDMKAGHVNATAASAGTAATATATSKPAAKSAACEMQCCPSSGCAMADARK